MIIILMIIHWIVVAVAVVVGTTPQAGMFCDFFIVSRDVIVVGSIRSSI